MQSFATIYAKTFYTFFSKLVGTITGLLPFSLVELLAYAAVLWIVWRLGAVLYFAIRHDTGKMKKHGKRFLRGVIQMLLFIGITYFLNCWISYRRDSFAVEIGLQRSKHSAEDLEKLCGYLVTEVNETEEKLWTKANAGTSEAVEAVIEKSEIKDEAKEGASEEYTAVPKAYRFPMDDTGSTYSVVGQGEETEEYNTATWSYMLSAGREAAKAMSRLGRTYTCLSGPYPKAKPVLFSKIWSEQQTTGFYSPFTFEANVNREIPYYDLPFTMCHELSHLRGFMLEDEANFIGILACADSDNLYFQYSAYVSAWVYVGNSLAIENPEAFTTLYGSLNARTRRDLQYNNAYWDQYRGKLAETHEKVNDTYLKANNQPAGTKTYDMVTELLLSYYDQHESLIAGS